MMINQWTIMVVVLLAIAAAVYFLFIRTKMDPRVKELADLAYKVAAKLAGLSLRGSTPPVRLMKKPWELHGITIIGNYKPVIRVWKWVLVDRILVVNDPTNIWSNMVHENTHAIRRRHGLPSSEAAAEAAEARANGMAPSNLAALLEKL